jgi:DNA-binding GntR family transcriptional regulator
MKVRRGAYVTEVNAKDVSDVFHLMALLEADAAAIAARSATDKQIKELQELHLQLEQSTEDHVKFFAINEAFHLKLLDIAKNRWRDQIVADLRKVMKLNRAQSLLKSGRIEQSLAEHTAIMQALKQRDAKLAMHAMRTHIESGQEAAG